MYHGFTLIKLLVIIAIMALLAAILFPIFSAACFGVKAQSSPPPAVEKPVISTLVATIGGHEWRATFDKKEVLLEKKDKKGEWRSVATGPRVGCQNILALAAGEEGRPVVRMSKMGGSILMELQLRRGKLVCTGPIVARDPTLPDPPDPMDG